jgi:hypothetical protein
LQDEDILAFKSRYVENAVRQFSGPRDHYVLVDGNVSL